MAYVKNNPAWVNGGAPGISEARLNNLETQYDECSTELGSSGGSIAVSGYNLIDLSVPSTALEQTQHDLAFKACYLTSDLATDNGGLRYDPDAHGIVACLNGSTELLATQNFAIALAIVL